MQENSGKHLRSKSHASEFRRLQEAEFMQISQELQYDVTVKMMERPWRHGVSSGDRVALMQFSGVFMLWLQAAYRQEMQTVGHTAQ